MEQLIIFAKFFKQSGKQLLRLSRQFDNFLLYRIEQSFCMTLNSIDIFLLVISFIGGAIFFSLTLNLFLLNSSIVSLEGNYFTVILSALSS